jgi:hypothetical protein
MIDRLAAIIAEVDPDHGLFTEDLAAAIVDRLVTGERPHRPLREAMPPDPLTP